MLCLLPPSLLPCCCRRRRSCSCCHQRFAPGSYWLCIKTSQLLRAESLICAHHSFALHITEQSKKRIGWSVEEKKRSRGNGGKQRTWYKKAQKKPRKLNRSYPPALLAKYTINLKMLTIWYGKALPDRKLCIKSNYTICIREASFLKGKIINLASCAREILFQYKMEREL